VCKADNLTTILCRCHEIWEPFGPLQACNRTALPLPLRVFQQPSFYARGYHFEFTIQIYVLVYLSVLIKNASFFTIVAADSAVCV
jgi:hypothetical protein